jgi:hypothetical protein
MPALLLSHLALRAVVLLAPMIALLATGPAGSWPPWWVVLAVLAMAGGFALVPDSHLGAGVFLAVLAWWAISTDGRVPPEILVAGAALVLAQVAAQLASYGPGELPLEAALLRRWARRCALLLLVVVATWGAARLVDGRPEQPGIWVLGVSAAVVATVVATIALTSEGAGGTR